MGSVRHISTAEEWDSIYLSSGDHLVVVCFTAAWCGPCRRIAPELDALAAANPEIWFVKIDVDAARHSINAISTVRTLPSFVLVRNKTQLDAMKGSKIKTLKSKIETHRSPAATT